MKRFFAKWLLIIGIAVTGLWLTGHVLGWFREAATVAREEFGPGELLRKYEWFKDAAANLDGMRSNIEIYAGRITRMKEDYRQTARSDWDRTDKEQMSLWEQEVAGVKAAYNGLAADYNAQMAKFNWRFCNAGELPEGATEVLPREFRTYIGE
jgi:hypothetical protein